MPFDLPSGDPADPGPVYVRENGRLLPVAVPGGPRAVQRPRPLRLFPKSFCVELRLSREDRPARQARTDHFIFTYTREGSLRYSAKPLFSLALAFISDNIDHVDSLVGFPALIAEKLFSAAEARQKFSEPGAGLRALRKFTEAYGSLVLCSLCLRNRYLVIAEKLEEVKSFRELACLDLSCCHLGDEHQLLEHITKDALSSVTRLHLKDNCLSDAGIRKMTAPVRVMRRGLENLMLLDLSCNPDITDTGIGYLFALRKLQCLDISGAGLKDVRAVKRRIRARLGLAHSKVPLREFDHSNCRTEGWADQVVLQWERVTAEAVRARENAASGTAARRFYGKRARAGAVVRGLPSGSCPESSGELQFYREETRDPPSETESVGSGGFRTNKKRAVEEEVDKGLTAAPPRAPEQKSTCLTLGDWDLLNSY
ncbi:leucine-rich repeat-containing protein 42 [Ornithorhynchus anatinus]|uniref:leucine-rich repeat-containing protein 42 n=1 Tax=Ornithorhynchus anatinus TaxID=9258 RepID=UPI0010A7B808|nr:leucine-rich repeat-containing protein 42 [Ornithorhynchus anatinus]